MSRKSPNPDTASSHATLWPGTLRLVCLSVPDTPVSATFHAPCSSSPPPGYSATPAAPHFPSYSPMPSYSPTPRCSPRPRLRHVPSRGEAPHTPLRTHSCALARLSHSPPLLQVPAAFPSPILSCATRLAVTPVPKASDLAVPRPGYSPSLLPLSPGSLGKPSTRFPSVPATPRAPATAKAQLPRILPPNSSSSCPQILLELTDSPDSTTT